MRDIKSLLRDKLETNNYFLLIELSNKYHCPAAFDFSIDIIGMSHSLFWLGVIAGSASANLDLIGCEICGEAMDVISKALF